MPPQKSFLRSIAEGFFWSTSGAAAVKVVGIAAALAVVAKLSLHEYGTYQLVLAAWGLFAAFLFSGIDSVVIARGTRILQEEGEEHAAVLGSGLLWFKAAVGVALWSAVYFGTDLASPWYSQDVLSHLKIVSFSFLVLPLGLLINYDFSIFRRFFALNVSGFAGELAKALGIALSLFVFNAGIPGILWATVASEFAKAVLFLPFMRLSYWRAPHSRALRPFMQLIFKQGRWVALRQYVGQLGANARIFFIQFFLGREAVALFSLAEKLMKHILTLFPMPTFLIPTISAQISESERLRQLLERGIKYSVPFFTLLGIFSAALASPVLSYLFPQYVPALPLFYVLLFYFPFSGINYLLVSFFFSHQEQRAYFFLTLMRYTFMVVALPIFIFLFGLIGVAFEYALNAVAINFFRYRSLVMIHPELRIRTSQVLTVDEYDRKMWNTLKLRLFARGANVSSPNS